MSRLIIISNRLPFSIERNENGIAIRQSSGGLVSAIKSYFDRPDMQTGDFTEKLWVGSMDVEEPEWNEAVKENGLPAAFGIEPIFPDNATYEQYYNGFSNSTLWPLFHYFPSVADYKKECFDAYRNINQLFAEKILEIYQPGDVICN
jgi:trehalose 6-phosphate synthase/phosphatase